jgi:hypothetical protein
VDETQKVSFQELISAVRDRYAIDLAAFPLSVNISRVLRICAFHEGRDPAVITISASSTARAEYEALRLLWEHIPAHVAAPIGLIALEGGTATIVSHVPHVKATAQALSQPQLVSQVGAVLAAVARTDRSEAKTVNEAAGECAIKEISAHELGFGSRYFDTVVQPILERVPRVRQHGDFVLSNLGVTPTGFVVVFDWEDYGRICYPGFDGATFLLSFSHHLGESRALETSPSSFLGWIDSRCGFDLLQACGISAREFAQLVGWNLAAFIHMKREFNYGRAISERAVRLAMQVRRSSDWMAFLEGRMTIDNR